MGPLMQGLHVFEPRTRTVIDLESFMPDDHLLREVDRFVQPAFIRKLTACCYAQGKGRPSIDPVVYFRMVLVGYLYGIDSDRRLCEDVYSNLAYRWFCRLSLKDKVPDHSSLSTIRDRYGEEIHEQVFNEIVKLCQQHGLVGESCSVITDATLIAADASLNSLIHNDTDEADKEAESQLRDRGLKDGSSARRVSNQTHTSRTDPDATLAQKKGTPRQLKYKVHQSIDTGSRVILDTHTSRPERGTTTSPICNNSSESRNDADSRLWKRPPIVVTVRRPSEDVRADVEERRIICRGQTEPRFVSGTSSRKSKGPNPSLHERHRSESQATGRGLLFLATRLVLTPKNGRYPLSPHSQKADFFNTPVGILTCLLGHFAAAG